MAELTAGYVAGLIAFVIVVGQISDQETAGTWTAAARALHGSLWPALLRSDPHNSHGVRGTVTSITWAISLLSFLVAIAGVITPLGLYEEDEISDKPFSPGFKYVPDSSAFLTGTSTRADRPFTRTCSMLGCTAPCPYTGDVLVIESNGTTSIECTDIEDVNATVPMEVIDIFTSGTKHSRTTVSNFFDIGWRQLTTRYDRDLNNGTPIAVGSFRPLESFALEDRIRVVEGLVVDGRTGGVGFRNHTIPQHEHRGVQWTEDLLFLQPESECVDNHLSIDFTVSTSLGSSSSVAMTDLVLTDRGGFTNFNKTNPLELTREESNTPNLKSRAYQAAWGTTAFTMFYLNVTNPPNETEEGRAYEDIRSEMNKTFRLPVNTDPDGLETYQSVDFGPLGYHLDVPISESSARENVQDNPWSITYEEFDYVGEICRGTYGYHHVRFNNTFVACTQVRGTPKRVNDGPENIFDDGSQWSSPLYTCASAVKATIKTVTFSHNGTGNTLENLHVENIEDKNYENDEDIPLWGIEDPGYLLTGFEPVWGLVDSAFEDFPDIRTLRDPSLYLIGPGNDFFNVKRLAPKEPLMNLPGVLGPIGAMHTIANFYSLFSNDLSGVLDLQATRSMSLWLRWKELSATEETMPLMMKLMWADLAASALVGTKGVLGPSNSDEDNAATVQVMPLVRRVKYRYLFAIPALILAFCLLVILLLLLVSILAGRASFKTLNRRLKQTAMGRVLTTIFYPGSSSYDMGSREWTKKNSYTPLAMGPGLPRSGRGSTPIGQVTASPGKQHP